MVKKMVRAFLALTVLLSSGTFFNLFAISENAFAATTGQYVNTNPNCLLYNGLSSQCNGTFTIQANVPGMLPGVESGQWPYKTDTKYDFSDNVSTLHVKAGDPAHATGTVGGKIVTITMTNPGAFTDYFSPSGGGSESQSTQKIIVNATVTFDKTDSTLLTEPLSFSNAVLLNGQPDVGAKKQDANPSIDHLTSKEVKYTTTYSPDAAGKYRVCASADFIKASGNQVCKDVTKVKGTVLTVNLTATGDSSKLTADPALTGENDPCAKATGAYAWMMCPAFKLAQDALDGFYDNVIQPMLQVDPLTGNSPIRPVWKAFVQVADVLFVLAFLILIFGQTLSIDAYTIKKSLPRLVIAAVAVQISFFLCGVIIDIGNILGGGMEQFVLTAIPPSDPTVHSLGKNLLTTGVVGISAAIGGTLLVASLGFGLIAMMIGLLISAFTFFVVLAVRKLLLNILILLSPLALVAWILPNTERYFKMWRDNFIKLVMVYPIIALLLAGAYIVQQASTAVGGTAASQISQVVAGLAPIIAFFMMPRVFKMSGSAFSAASGVIRSRGGSLAKLGKGATQNALDNSALLKQRKETKLRENLQTMGDPNSGRIKRAIAQRKAGFGYAPTAGALADGFSKLESIEKSNEGGATRQMSDIPANQLKDVLSKKVGETATFTLADGTMKMVKISADHKTAAIRMMASKGRWDDLRDARNANLADASSGVTATELSKGLAGTESFTKARDLTMSDSDAFRDMSADGLANMHASTVRQYMSHIESLRASDPAKHAEKVKQLESAASSLLDNKNLSSKLSSDTLRLVSAAANGATLPSGDVVDKLMQDTNVISKVNDRIDGSTATLKPKP